MVKGQILFFMVSQILLLYMIPKNVTFKNFSIDYVRPFHSEAIIIQNKPDGIDVMIPKVFHIK